MPSISVPAAIAIGAGVSGAAAIGGSLLSSSAAKSAAGTQANAATAAAQLQEQEQQQVRGDLSPFRTTGAAANARLGSLFGLGTGATGAASGPTGTVSDYLASSGNGLPNGYKFVNTADGLNIVDGNGNLHWANVPANAPIGDIIHSVAPDQEPVAPSQGGPTGGTGGAANPLASTNEESALEATPGYKFTLDQGLKSVQNSAAARGLGTSGAALKGAASYVTGLADSTYQSNLLNPLEYLSTTGEGAAAQTGTLGTQGAANAGAGIVGAGNATAAGTVGAANATAGALGSIANTAGSLPLNYLLYNNLLGGGGGGAGSASSPTQLGGNY